MAAWAQDRLGPNRVGPFGLLQPIADGLKFLLKEDIVPSHVDRLFFLLAPCIAVGTATLAFAVFIILLVAQHDPLTESAQAAMPLAAFALLGALGARMTRYLAR